MYSIGAYVSSACVSVAGRDVQLPKSACRLCHSFHYICAATRAREQRYSTHESRCCFHGLKRIAGCGALQGSVDELERSGKCLRAATQAKVRILVSAKTLFRWMLVPNLVPN